MPKKNKDILVWFGDGEDDFELREKIRRHCRHMSESTFMKIAAEEKIERDEFVRKNFINGIPAYTVPQQSQVVKEKPKDNTPKITEEGLDGFLDSF